MKPAPGNPLAGNPLAGVPLAVTLLLLAATLAGAVWSEGRNRATPLARPLAQMPAELAGWQATAEAPLEAAVLEQLKPTSYLSRTYARMDTTGAAGGQRLGLLIVYYAQQRAGESMHSPEHCLPGGGWQIERREREWLPLAGGQVGVSQVGVNQVSVNQVSVSQGRVNQVSVNRYRIAHAGEHDVMYYWYQSRRRVIAQEWLAKPLLAWDALATGRSEGALVRITLPDSGNGAGQAATGFAAAVLAEMQRSF